MTLHAYWLAEKIFGTKMTSFGKLQPTYYSKPLKKPGSIIKVSVLV